MTDELRFSDLCERHHGLTPAVSASYAEAACVCLNRHHLSGVVFRLVDDGVEVLASVKWIDPSDRVKAAWNNLTDATEAGACALAIAAVEHSRGLVAVRRAETRTGSDYYLDRPGSIGDDLENAFRLEVSGTDAGDANELRRRLAMKVRQAQNGNSNLPAMACVVGFAAMRIETVDVP